MPSKISFSISYFGTYPAEYEPNKYKLLLEGSQVADKEGFEAVWIPERHFHSFGGFSPNPSVLAAAISRITENVKLRAGSIVAPLHHPARIAEEWSVVDNLSGGRVGLGFAPGWHPNDFILTPNHFDERKADMYENINIVRSLWKGNTHSFKNAQGKIVDVSIHPRPLQKELDCWVAILGSPESFYKAGQIGAGILTNLIVQDVKQLEENIKIYKEGLKDGGFPGEKGKVTALLHTHIDEDKERAIEVARAPLYAYLESSMQLFTRTHSGRENEQNIQDLPKEDRDFLFGRAYKRYLDAHALIGNNEMCYKTFKQLSAIGVTEFAAFIDFGIAPDIVSRHLKQLCDFKNYCLKKQQ